MAIDQYGHFGKAAEACGLTQSTLSLMVKKLEEELDVRIFDRDAHPVTPTEIGRKVIDGAKVVLYNVEQIAEMTRSEKDILTGPLRIALISTVAPVLIPGLFKHIGDNYPSISLQTEEMLSETIKDKLRKAEVDMGIMSGPVKDADLLEIPLYHERFLAYVSSNNPAYAQESIRMEDILDQPVWIIRDGLRQLDPSELKTGEITYDRFFEGGRVGILIQVVNNNGGITIIPETHINLLTEPMRACLKPIVNPEPKRTICLAFRKDYIHEQIMNIVVKSIKTIIPYELWDDMIRAEHLRL
jgi:LysR family hydrogen peroxide-inducible transcriptional activator